ncbi:DMT family transporter [Salinarimonas soli]|uniref:DMT family transporter n=1 Tax=Salinarimonas soli TaxID=1638099 RepID=UPI001F0AC0DD|nr:DMT family transporter [Salinarimonas soli]
MKPLLGIALKVSSALAFTLMAALIKLVSATYPTGQLVFFRSAFALLPLLAWLAWRGDLVGAIRTHNLRGHVLRSLIGCTGMFAGFVSLTYLPLTDSVAIGYAAPLIVVILAAVVLKETVRAYRWSAVGVGFFGVMVMLWPHLGAPSHGPADAAAIGAAFGVLGACCAAGATIQVRRLTASETTGAIVFYFTILSSLFGLLTIVLGWRMPGAFDLGVFVVIGILGGIGQILLTQSYRYGDASLVAPFEYTTMIWALLIGWFGFGQWPQPVVFTGASIVAGAGIFVLWREHRLGLRRAKDLEVPSQRSA